jgi:hypothetical protein
VPRANMELTGTQSNLWRAEERRARDEAVLVQTNTRQTSVKSARVVYDATISTFDRGP